MFCKKCGTELNPTQAFCTQCGTKVENQSTGNNIPAQQVPYPAQQQSAQPYQAPQQQAPQQPLNQNAEAYYQQPIAQQTAQQTYQQQPNQQYTSAPYEQTGASAPYYPQMQGSVKKRSGKKKFGIIAAVIIAVLVCGSVLGYAYKNDILYAVKPTTYVKKLVSNTTDRILKENDTMSENLFGFKPSRENITANVHIGLNSVNDQDLNGTYIDYKVNCGLKEMQLKAEAGDNDGAIISSAAKWNDEEIGITVPEINNKEYYIPVKNFASAWNKSVFASSLGIDTELSDVFDDISYTKYFGENKETDIKKYIEKLIDKTKFNNRKKVKITFNGKECTAYTVDASVKQSEVADILCDLVDEYSAVFLSFDASGEISDSLKDLKDEIRSEFSGDKALEYSLIECDNCLVGFEFDVPNMDGTDENGHFVFQFNESTLINGFTLKETQNDISITMGGNVIMENGKLDVSIKIREDGNTTEVLKLVMDMKQGNGSLKFDDGDGDTFDFTMNCSNDNGLKLSANSIDFEDANFDIRIGILNEKANYFKAGSKVNILNEDVNALGEQIQTDAADFLTKLAERAQSNPLLSEMIPQPDYSDSYDDGWEDDVFNDTYSDTFDDTYSEEDDSDYTDFDNIAQGW